MARSVKKRARRGTIHSTNRPIYLTPVTLAAWNWLDAVAIDRQQVAREALETVARAFGWPGTADCAMPATPSKPEPPRPLPGESLGDALAALLPGPKPRRYRPGKKRSA